MFDQGQFYPTQPIQFMEGLLAPAMNAPLFDVVGSAAGGNGTSNTTSTTVTLPAGNAGSLLILWLTVGNNVVPGAISGWTATGNVPVGGGQRTQTYYRVADGSEGASMSVSHGSATTAYGIVRVSGQFGNAPESSGVGVGSGANPNPPSLTPSWGSAPNLWFAANCTFAFAMTALPSGYTQVINKVVSPDQFSICIAYLKATATSQDPGAFTVGGSSGSSTTFTTAVRGS